MWIPGDEILIRHIRDHVRYAIPMTVVADEGERVVAFLHEGTRCKWTHLDFVAQTVGSPVDHVWGRTQVLHIYEIGAWHGVRVFFNPDTGTFRSWHIDMQLPNLRTYDGIVTCDCSLDITADADLNWKWKDQDEFEKLPAMGWIDEVDFDRLRAEADLVIEHLEKRRSPFDEPWPDWRPDKAWPIPPLPVDWDRVPQEAYP